MFEGLDLEDLTPARAEPPRRWRLDWLWLAAAVVLITLPYGVYLLFGLT